MSGSTAFDLKTIQLSDFSRSHLSILRELIEMNPDAPLASIAEQANGLTALATCPSLITVKILLALGYTEPLLVIAQRASQETDKGNGKSNGSAGTGTLTSTTIRLQLEGRHNKIQDRIYTILEGETLTGAQLKVFEALSKIDEKLLTQLLDLMNEESAPLLPMGIIVMCLRQLGVAEEDIDFIMDI